MEIFQTGSRAEKVARMFSILPFKLTLHEIMIHSCLLLHLLYTQTTNYIYLYKFIHICLPCSYHLHRAMCHGWNNANMLADPVCGLPWAIIGGREGGYGHPWGIMGGRIMQIYLQIQFTVTEPVYRREDNANVLADPFCVLPLRHYGREGGREGGREMYIFFISMTWTRQISSLCDKGRAKNSI